MKKKKSNLINPIYGIHKSLEVEKIIPGGDGLIHLDGKVIFIPGVLPGEIIDFKIVGENRNFSRASLINVIRSSEDRVVPFCTYYGRCGGCNMQHINYDRQLLLKESFVREHFQRLAGIELTEDFTFVPSKTQSYRNRVQFHKSDKKCGFKMRSDDKVIPITSCPVLVDPLNQFLSENGRITNKRETFFGYNNHFWNESQPETITVKIMDHPVNFRADLFFQSNLSILPELLDFALAGYSGHHAMDLYCGVGLFSIFLKQRFSKITAIELNPETESYYKRNMVGAEFEYFGMSLEDWLNTNKKDPADLIIIDPPRTGLSPYVRSFLIDMNVRDLVYISCDPVTQARDTKELINAGYMIIGIKGFDFYPHSNHMETVIRFKKR